MTLFYRPLSRALAAASLLTAVSLPSAQTFAQDLVAPPEKGSLSLGIGATGEFTLSSKAIGEVSATLPSLNALSGGLADAPADVELNSLSLDDFYGSFVGVQASAGYGLTDAVEIFARFGYLESGSDSTAEGTVVETGNPFGFQGRVTATLDSYEEFNIAGGARYFFNRGGDFRPYVGAYGGVRIIDGVDARLSVTDANTQAVAFDIYDGALFEDTTALTAGGEMGIAYSFSRNFTMSVNVGVNWTDDWDLAEGNGADNPIANPGETGRRISLPIRGGFTYTF